MTSCRSPEPTSLKFGLTSPTMKLPPAESPLPKFQSDHHRVQFGGATRMWRVARADAQFPTTRLNRPYAEYRIMPSKMRARRRRRRRTPLISALSECREEGQQIVAWAEAVEDLACRFDLFEGLLLHL